MSVYIVMCGYLPLQRALRAPLPAVVLQDGATPCSQPRLPVLGGKPRHGLFPPGGPRRTAERTGRWDHRYM